MNTDFAEFIGVYQCSSVVKFATGYITASDATDIEQRIIELRKTTYTLISRLSTNH